jgi:hypothetical protein
MPNYRISFRILIYANEYYLALVATYGYYATKLKKDKLYGEKKEENSGKKSIAPCER